MSQDILIRVEGRAGRITLNRPQALNALTYDMLRAIEDAVDAWAVEDAIDLVIIDAAGDKAFAAGGDIVDLYRTGRAGDFAFGRQFWADEYRLNAKIARYPKPYIALMQGFVMGGGVGVSCHGSHRVVDESAQIAMPECSIGLIPDVGGSRLLALAPEQMGIYLGLTGTRMDAGDAIFAGFADSFVPRARWVDLIAALCASGDAGKVANFAESPPGSRLHNAPEINDWFLADTASGILAELETRETENAGKVAATLRKQCPLSVACALQAIRNAREMTVKQALAQEYRFVWRCMEEGEFLEGIRAAVIDKDRNPRWARPRLEDIQAEDVAHMLSPPPGGDLTF
ncbi:MAG: enoyl-CoA hydratase/isomerase family protein [Pseudomonadota bacterium]